MAYDDPSLQQFAVTLRASETRDWQPSRYRRLGPHAAPREVRDLFYKNITGAHEIRPIHGVLGKAMQHTLLWERPDRPHTYVENWDLDAAGVDPAGYLDQHAPKWLKRTLASLPS